MAVNYTTNIRKSVIWILPGQTRCDAAFLPKIILYHSETVKSRGKLKLQKEKAVVIWLYQETLLRDSAPAGV